MLLSKKTKELFFGLLVSLFSLLVIECIARIAYTFHEDIKANKEKWWVYSKTLGWELNPGFHGNVMEEVNIIERRFDNKGFLYSDTSKILDQSKPKVIFIGDSSTFGYRLQMKSTFVEILGNQLSDISTINLGVPGYTSFQGYKVLLKRGLELNPKIVVVSFNLNDRRYVLGKEFIDSDELFKKTYEISERNKLLQRIYLYRAIKYLFVRLGVTGDEELAARNRFKNINISNLRARVSPDNYRRNLEDIIKLSRTKNIHVVFLILNDNPFEKEYLTKGIELFNNQKYDLAIEKFIIAYRFNNFFSVLAQQYLEKTYRKLGLTEEANRYSVLEMPINHQHGGRAIYLDTEYNQIMRDVAIRYNIETIEAGKVLDKNPSNYLDVCHPDENGNREIAFLLSRSINRLLNKRGSSRRQ